MPQDPNVPTSLLQEKQIALRDRMANQHPFHERLALVYEQMGGDQALLDWAVENPSRFYEMMMKASPPPQGAKGGGGLNLTLALHPALAPGPLDVGGITIDG